MKTRLLLICSALALASGCATYTGGTASEEGFTYGAGASYVDPHHTPMGWPSARAYQPMEVYPVYKQPPASGQEMGGTRPEFYFYR
jgi:hypothetical protein